MPLTLDRKPTPQEAVRIQAHYRQHPEFFFKYFLGVEAWGKQLEIANSIINNRVTTVRSCHSAGKSYIAACIALWYLSSFPASIVVTTAPTWRQVKDILWRNINTRYAAAKVPLGGSAPNMTGWEIDTNWFAIGVSSKDPDRIQGYHAESGHLLVICDEAAGIEEPIFEGVDAILTSEKCRKLEIGNPTSSSGTFRENHKPGAPTNKIKISAFDTPNFTANGIHNVEELEIAMKQVRKGERKLVEVADYLIGPSRVYEWLKKWGPNNPMFKARVLAEFPDVGESNLIPLSLIEAACTDERLEHVLGLHLKHPQLIGPDGKPTMSEAKFEQIERENDRIRQAALAEYIASHNTCRGVDVAYQGSDASVIQPRWGSIVGNYTEYHGQDPVQLAGRVWSRVTNMPTDYTGIDVIGIGEGTVGSLRQSQEEYKATTGAEHWANIVRVDVRNTAKTNPLDMPMMNFPNKRNELYWKLRERFQSGDIYLMPDEDGNLPEDLMAELSAIEYTFRGNKIFVEEKADMKKRLHGKSPDHADALMISFAVGGSSDEANVIADPTFQPDAEEEQDWEPEVGATVRNEINDYASSLSFDDDY